MGATRLIPAIACALTLAFAPAASAATGDLTVSVARLTVPATVRVGQTTGFAVRYVVRGPVKRRANATVLLVLTARGSTYRIESKPALIRPAIWNWSVNDKIPKALGKGSYRVVATITLRRSGRFVDATKKSAKITLS
ncbi:MAG TPA: hypothetical protein VGF46_07015 [Gaiellales bacterium]